MASKTASPLGRTISALPVRELPRQEVAKLVLWTLRRAHSYEARRPLRDVPKAQQDEASSNEARVLTRLVDIMNQVERELPLARHRSRTSRQGDLLALRAWDALTREFRNEKARAQRGLAVPDRKRNRVRRLVMAGADLDDDQVECVGSYTWDYVGKPSKAAAELTARLFNRSVTSLEAAKKQVGHIIETVGALAPGHEAEAASRRAPVRLTVGGLDVEEGYSEVPCSDEEALRFFVEVVLGEGNQLAALVVSAYRAGLDGDL